MLANVRMTGTQVRQVGCKVWPGLTAGRGVCLRDGYVVEESEGRRRRKQADVRARLRTFSLSLHSTLQAAVKQTYNSASDDQTRK